MTGSFPLRVLLWPFVKKTFKDFFCHSFFQNVLFIGPDLRAKGGRKEIKSESFQNKNTIYSLHLCSVILSLLPSRLSFLKLTYTSPFFLDQTFKFLLYLHKKCHSSFQLSLTREPTFPPPKRAPPSPLLLQKTSRTFPDSNLTTSSCEESPSTQKSLRRRIWPKQRKEGGAGLVFRNWEICKKHQDSTKIFYELFMRNFRICRYAKTSF